MRLRARISAGRQPFELVRLVRSFARRGEFHDRLNRLESRRALSMSDRSTGASRASILVEISSKKAYSYMQIK